MKYFVRNDKMTRTAYEELRAKFAKAESEFPNYKNRYLLDTSELIVGEAAFRFGACLVGLLNGRDVLDMLVGISEQLQISAKLLQDRCPSPDLIKAHIKQKPQERLGPTLGDFRREVIEIVTMFYGSRLGALFEAIECFYFALGSRIGTMLAIREDILNAANRARILNKDFEVLVGRLGSVSTPKEGEEIMADFGSWFRTELAKPLAFVSYQTLDERVATEVVELLESSGLRGFLANRDLLAGQEWEEELRGALERSAVVIIIVTPHALQSQWVTMEIGAAWMLRKRTIGLLVSVQSSQLPDYAKTIQAQPFETVEDRQIFSDALRRQTRLELLFRKI